ncbi:NAD(P)-dependent oxidoreductase [Mesorhizobium sp. LHD-90]|uniref:NAD(P)-dependent oxidoreductase n=1 Tax=Mesorhizobium sp. LHD-90 TaxID=3071414 RepID=UPI0027DEEC0D|nr:NAD(P)-dependent oxidoreductase [Mesorhizobium sp. LHD-90]MDQ6434291.1 NAD(P)-dependent oxidoreductase [Mesorhizobium sp. LHD-90]
MTDAADPGPVAFVGLGMMGLPMASRLAAAGYSVRGSDLSTDALAAFERAGGKPCASPQEAAEGVSVLITMLPNGAAVRDVLLGAGAAASALRPGALVIDMSSSAPMETRWLAEDLSAIGIFLVDAPVSGGVKRAAAGTLAIMAGGDPVQIERARPILSAMGSTIVPTGEPGSGHAVKALNNYVSAAGLVAACEAVLIAEKFGVDPNVLVDVLNVSTGKNNSTELKLKPFILSGSFASGFSMALMAKDLRTAADLSEQLGVDAEGARDAAALWAEASAALGRAADHTEIHRFVAGRSGKPEKGG